MALVDALLPEFDREITLTRTMLERIPESRLGWKPHVTSFSLGELGLHLSRLPTWATETLAKSEIDIGATPPQATIPTRADMLAAFDRHAADARAALVGTSDPELAAMWTLKRNGRAVFSMPKASVLRTFVLSHLIHHRGQLSVYLRLLDVPVPSTYGPSADEPAF